MHISTVHRLSDPRIRLKQCRSLAAHGATVRLIAQPSPIGEFDDGVETVALRSHASRFERVTRGQLEVLQHIRELAPDIVHFHDPELLALAPAMRGVLRIYDVHESLPDLVLDRDWIPARLRGLVGQLCGVVEPLLARSCDAFVFVDRRWAPRFPDRPWREIKNSPLEGEFKPVDRSRQPSKPHFVYVGELLEERGVHSAVRCVNALPFDATLTLAGPVSDHLASELHRLDTGGRLRLPGLIDRPTVGALLATATAGLVLLEPVPAYDDATATKIYEYLNAGLPMVLSDTTAHRRIAASSGAAVVVDYDNDDQLVAAMHRLVNDPSHWRGMAAASQAAASSARTWTDEAADLIDLYQEVAMNRSRPQL